MAAGSGLDPQNLKDTPNATGTWARVLGQGQVQALGPGVSGLQPVQGLGPRVFAALPHSHLCAKRDGG